MRAIAHRVGSYEQPLRRFVFLPLWEPTPWAMGLPWRDACNRPQGWAPTNTPTANCFVAFVGAHPVGDWLALAVRVKSPTGVGSYKQPSIPSVLLPLWEPTLWAIDIPWRYASNRPQGWAPTNSRPCHGFVAFVGAHPVGDWFSGAVFGYLTVCNNIARVIRCSVFVFKDPSYSRATRKIA